MEELHQEAGKESKVKEGSKPLPTPPHSIITYQAGSKT